MFDWSTILPPKRNDYAGHRFAFYYLIVVALRNTFRGCVHYFAPDGGSGTIAGIPLETYLTICAIASFRSSPGASKYFLMTSLVRSEIFW